MVESDDYILNVAHTEFRDGVENADLDRSMAVFAPEVTNFSSGSPSFYQKDGREAMRARLQALVDRYAVELGVIIIFNDIHGDFAVQYGWHDWKLTPRRGGLEKKIYRTRFMLNWKKSGERWLIKRWMDNLEFEPVLLADDVERLRREGPRLPV